MKEEQKFLPLKKFPSESLREPKRIHSEKMLPRYSSPDSSSPEILEKIQTNTSLTENPLKSATEFYTSKIHKLSGTATPPPIGYQYTMPLTEVQNYHGIQQNPSAPHYSTNTLPNFYDNYLRQNFQHLQISNTNPSYGQPNYYQTPASYFPVYYPQNMPPNMSQVVYQNTNPQNIYYQPNPYMPPNNNNPTLNKKKSLKHSQFRPVETYTPPIENEEHKAANEDHILSIIRDYLENNNELETLRGKVVALALTQTGSRFLQKQLMKSDPSFISFVLEEVENALADLMVDDYGNYFCQRLISSCSPPQRISFISKVFYYIYELFLD